MLRPRLQTAFDRSDETTDQATQNKAMDATRVAVECNYNYLKQIWYKNDLLVYLACNVFQIGLLYVFFRISI